MHSDLSSLPSCLRQFIKLCQFLGIFGLSLSSCPRQRYRNERLLWAWSLFWLLCFSVFVVYIFTSDEDFLFLSDSFGHFNDVLKVILAQIAVTSIYLESLLRRDALHRFWILFVRLHKSQPRILRDEASQNWRHYGRFLVIFHFTNFVSLLVWMLFFFLQKFNRHLVLFWSMFAPYIYVVHYRNIQFILHMEIMRLELVTLRQDLRLLRDYTRFARRVSTFAGFEEFLRRNLLQKQKAYATIYEMFKSFQEAFGFSIITCFQKVAVRVMVDAYFIFYVVYKDIDQYAEIALIIPALLEIPIFLITARNCMNVVKHITFELHNIASPVDGESALSVQIQNFSLQILHQRIRINGLGITTMDGYMLMRVVGTVTTYMIFFIQFMPKIRTLSKVQ